MESLIKIRRDTSHQSCEIQRQYFLDNREVETATPDGFPKNERKPIREEFLNRVYHMQEDVISHESRSLSREPASQKRNGFVSADFQRSKGFTRQSDADGNLVLYKDGEKRALIANYIPKLLRIMVDEDGKRILQVNVIPANSLPLHQRETFVIDLPEEASLADEVQSKRKSLTLECNFSRARSNLDAFVMDQSAHLQEELVFTRPGIVKTDQGYDFVDRNGSLRGFDLNVNMQQELSYNLMWPEKYIANTIMELLQMSEELDKILPLLLFSVMSRISELFELANCRPKFYLQLCGRTGSLKTSVALAVLCPYQNADGDLPPGTFEHTAAALEIEASRHKGAPFLVDDIHPCNNQSTTQKMNKAFATLVRMYGDGSSNARANGSMKRQKSHKASGLCAFTAEYPLGSESDRARGIIIDVGQATYKRDVLSFYQQNPTVVPTFLANLMRYVLPNADQLVKLISQEFLSERLAYLGKFEHGRQTDCYACLEITAKILLQYLVSQGVVGDEEKTEKYWQEAIFRAVESGQAEIKAHNPVAVFAKTFHGMVTTNQLPFAPYEARQESSKKVVAGFFDDQYYYLHFETVFKLVLGEASKLGTPINMNKNQMILALANEGLLEVFPEQRNGKSYEVRTKKISLSKSERAQMVLLKRCVLTRKMEEFTND